MVDEVGDVGEQHFDVGLGQPASLEVAICAALAHAVRNPRALGGRVLGWDLSWVRSVERDTVMLAWDTHAVEVSFQLVKDAVETKSWVVAKYIAEDLLRPSLP